MATVSFNVFEVTRTYNRDDECDMRLSRKMINPSKGHDGPNPSTTAFAELVADYFNRGWSTSSDLLILYGDEYIGTHTGAFLATFSRAFEVLSAGKKYGLLGDSSGLAVRPDPACYQRFQDCYSEFYDACAIVCERPPVATIC